MNDFSHLRGSRGVIYARRSTDNYEQKENSIPEQLQICRKFAKDYGIILPYRVFSDAKSGSSELDDWKMMKEEILNGSIEVDFILAENSDRISRHSFNQYTIDMEPLQEKRINFILVKQGDNPKIQTPLPDDEEMGEYIQSYVTQTTNFQYSVKHAQRLLNRSVLKAEEAKVHGKIPFGWIIERERHPKTDKVVDWSYVPHPQDSLIVQRMFECFIETENLAECLKILRESSMYPKKRCVSCCERRQKANQKLNGLAVNPDVEVCEKTLKNEFGEEIICGDTEFVEVPCDTSIVRSILRNQVHVGDYAYGKVNTGKFYQHYNGEVVNVRNLKKKGIQPAKRHNEDARQAWAYSENNHVGIVERSVYERVQSILNKNKSLGRKGRKGTAKYSGKLFCSHCGSRMHRNTSKGFPRYYCELAKSNRNGHLCEGGTKSIAENEIDLVLNEELHRILCDPMTHLKQINEVLELVKEREFLNQNKKNSGMEDLYAQLDKVKKTMENLGRDVDLYTIEHLSKQRRAIEEEIEQASESVKKLDEDGRLGVFDGVAERFQDLKNEKIEEHLESFSEMTFGGYMEQICAGVLSSIRINKWAENVEQIKMFNVPGSMLLEMFDEAGIEISKEQRKKLETRVVSEFNLPIGKLSADGRVEAMKVMFAGMLAAKFKDMKAKEVSLEFGPLIERVEFSWLPTNSSAKEFANTRLGKRFQANRMLNIPTDFSVFLRHQDENQNYRSQYYRNSCSVKL